MSVCEKVTVGYVQQAFERMCAKQAILHGEENEPYRQRSDVLVASTGLKAERAERLVKELHV